MNIVFYHFNTVLPPYLTTFVSSIRQHIPTANIVHLTDNNTPPCPGADTVMRFTSRHVTQPVNVETVGYAGFYCLAECGIQDMLFCDPDMLIVYDISPLMDTSVEVTVASRPSTDSISKSYRGLYPYNGFMVIKDGEFWKDCYWRMHRFRSMNWARNMEAVGAIVNSGWYTTAFLDGDIYNAKPKKYDPNVKVYHFRVGKAKDTAMPTFYSKYIEGRNGH